MTQKDETGLHRFFDSNEVTSLTGIAPFYLNKLVERGLYGVTASIKAGKGRGSRRLFSEGDLFGIALVWYLFEAGLRSKTIQLVFNGICGDRRSSASDSALRLRASASELLVIQRRVRTSHARKKAHPEQQVFSADLEDAAGFMKNSSAMATFVMPVGNMFSQLDSQLH